MDKTGDDDDNNNPPVAADGLLTTLSLFILAARRHPQIIKRYRSRQIMIIPGGKRPD